MRKKTKALDDFIISIFLLLVVIGAALFIFKPNLNLLNFSKAEYQTNIKANKDRKPTPGVVKTLTPKSNQFQRTRLLTESTSIDDKIENPEKAKYENKTIKKLNEEEIKRKLHNAFSSIDSGDWVEAEKILRKILESNPENESALLELAMIQIIDKNDFESAQNLMEKIITIDPENDTVIEELITIYNKTNRLEEGLSFFKKLNEKTGGSAAIQQAIAKALVEQGYEEEAMTHLRQAAEYTGESYDQNREKLADSFSEKGDNTRALEIYKEIMESKGIFKSNSFLTNSENATLSFKYVTALVNDNQFEDAEEILKMIEKQDPNNDWAIALRNELDNQI